MIAAVVGFVAVKILRPSQSPESNIIAQLEGINEGNSICVFHKFPL